MVILRSPAEIIGYKEFKQFALYKALAAEFFGTLILVFASCSSAEFGLAVSLATGITLATVIQSLGHVSGGHVNPAVTLSSCLSRQTSVLRALMYIVVQLLGGLAAAGILYGVVPVYHQSTVGMVMKNEDITNDQALGVEVVTTFIFIIAVQGMTDPKKSNLYGAAPLGIGLTLGANIMFGGWLSGACMNPARALGPMVVGDPEPEIWAYHWIYWVGPFLGSMLATGVYQLLFRQHSPADAISTGTQHVTYRE